MVGGAVKAADVALSEPEVDQVLAAAGLEDNEGGVAREFKGQGGFHFVVRIALFASMGGLLFGLDVGYIAGVKSMRTFDSDVLHGKPLTDQVDSDITMMFGVGASIAAFPPILGSFVDRVGRKGSMVYGGLLFCAGALLQGVAMNLSMMMIGRFLAGMSVGVLSANVPVYVSELAPPAYRGTLVSGYQLAITLGIMIAFMLALALEDVEEPLSGWRFVILAQLIPGLILSLGGLLMPRSPRWLMSKGRCQEALATLVRVRGPEDNVRLELAQICREQENERASGKPSWGEFFSGDMLKLLCIGMSLQLTQQLCGMNAFMYDGPLIFARIFNSEHSGRIFTAVSGAVNIASTFPAILFVDKKGRRTMLMWSAATMGICSAVLAFVGELCFPLGLDIIADPICGDWAKWTATTSICVFIFGFGFGWGPVVWTYCAEMFPMKYRSKAVAATTDANWVGNILIAFLPPIMFQAWGFSCFWVFVGVNVLGFILSAHLPETKDKSLEEINLMFQAWFHPVRNAAGQGKELSK